MSTSLIIDVDGTVREIQLPKGENESLTAMYDAIGCKAFDVVRLTSQLDMWVDDEGLFTAPHNHVATQIAARYGHVYQRYHGRALICGSDRHGNTVNLTDAQVRAIRTQMAEIW